MRLPSRRCARRRIFFKPRNIAPGASVKAAGEAQLGSRCRRPTINERIANVQWEWLEQRGRYTRIAGVPVKPIYLYTAGAVALLLVIYLVMRFLSTSLVMHFSAFAGVLVLIANLRELLGNSYGQRGSTALLNVMVGGGLIFAWLTQFFGVLFWIPALILVGVAAPLIFGRANVYNAYLDMARSLATNVRRTFVR